MKLVFFVERIARIARHQVTQTKGLGGRKGMGYHPSLLPLTVQFREDGKKINKREQYIRTRKLLWSFFGFTLLGAIHPFFVYVRCQ